MAVLIDGKKISAQVKDECKERVAKENMDVTLAVIQVGNDPASTVYVGNKKKACEYVGIHSLSYELPEETTEEELLALVEKLNADDTVNGILVQLPEKRCGWISSAERWCVKYRSAGLCILYAGGHHSALKEKWCGN